MPTEVAAVDALEALRDDGLHAEQAVPFAAQSRELAGAVFLAGEDRRAGCRALWYLIGGIVDRHHARRRAGSLVTPPSTPGTIRFLMRTLAKVPRVMTRSLPRREP